MIIYSDGGCEGNPGPGAWAAILIFGPHRREVTGAELATTNNRMELSAAIGALKSLKEPCVVEFHTDSTYLREGISQWIHSWKRRGWITTNKKPVKNKDLWVELDSQATRHRIDWKWVRGHAGHPENERCDVLAREAVEELKKKTSKEDLAHALEEFNRREQGDEEPKLMF